MAFFSIANCTTLPWAVIFGLVLPSILYIGLRARSQRGVMKGMPQPPNHSLIWGHLKHFGDLRTNYASDLHPHMYPYLLQRKFNLPDIFYIDLWPVTWAMLIVADPVVANNQLLMTEKHESVTDFMATLTGDKNLVAMHGPEWKRWRAIFNPGFSSAHLMTLVPGIVQECSVFCDILDERVADGTVFRLEEAATLLTVDIIGSIILDKKFNVQREKNPFLDALKNQIWWLTTTSTLSLHTFNPVRIVMQWWNRRVMDNYIREIIVERFKQNTGEDSSPVKRKHVIDLALETYIHGDGEDVKAQASAGKSVELDSTFLRYAIDQIRVFMFAGHDTTSSTICYVCHMLEKHPDVRAKLFAEHEEVFGKDLDAVGDLIRNDPHLLNRLTYTNDVIKEVLRMFPPASSVRKGSKDLILVDPKTGAKFPTENTMVWINHVSIHRNPRFWQDPDTFNPDRYSSSSTDGGKKDSWRPFEVGPRACIGQALAILETKVIIAMTVRKYRITAAYDALDTVLHDGLGWPSYGNADEEVLGEIAYQTLRGTAKPRQGMPARVALRT